MVDNDVNCCPTHNTIEPPAEGSPLRTIDADSLGRIVSVYAETQRFSGLADPPLTQAVRQEVAAGVPQSDAPSSNNSSNNSTTSSATSCARGTVILKLKRPKGLRLSRANIYVNGKFIKRYRGRGSRASRSTSSCPTPAAVASASGSSSTPPASAG